MKINLEEITYIVGLATTIFITAWRLSQQKAEILKLIDVDMRQINQSLNDIKYNLGVHMAEYANREQLTDFKLKTIDENIESNFKRCQQQIREIQGFLKRDTSYNVRDNIVIE